MGSCCCTNIPVEPSFSKAPTTESETNTNKSTHEIPTKSIFHTNIDIDHPDNKICKTQDLDDVILHNKLIEVWTSSKTLNDLSSSEYYTEEELIKELFNLLHTTSVRGKSKVWRVFKEITQQYSAYPYQTSKEFWKIGQALPCSYAYEKRHSLKNSIMIHNLNIYQINESEHQSQLSMSSVRIHMDSLKVIRKDEIWTGIKDMNIKQLRECLSLNVPGIDINSDSDAIRDKCILRLMIILNLYQLWIKSNMNAIENVIFVKNYGFKEIVHDFDGYVDQYYIKEKIEFIDNVFISNLSSKCPSKCRIKERHLQCRTENWTNVERDLQYNMHGSLTDDVDDENVILMSNVYSNKLRKESDNYSSIDEHKITIIQFLDKMHHFLLHNPMWANDENADNLQYIAQRKGRLSAQHSRNESLLEEVENSNNSHSSFLININKSYENFQARGKFHWQTDHSNDERIDLPSIKAKFSSLKEEVLFNTFWSLPKQHWNDTLLKIHTIIGSWTGKKIRTYFTGEYKEHKWVKGEKISGASLISLKLYTDYDKLQRELSICARFVLSSKHKTVYEAIN